MVAKKDSGKKAVKAKVASKAKKATASTKKAAVPVKKTKASTKKAAVSVKKTAGPAKKAAASEKIDMGQVKKVDDKSAGFQSYLDALGVMRVLVWGLVIGIIVGGVFAYAVLPRTAAPPEWVSPSAAVAPGGAQALSKAEITEKTRDYIIANMVSPSTSVVVTDVTEENGLYKLVINLAIPGGPSQDVESYAAKDGSLFFPSVLDMTAPISTSPPTTSSAHPTITPTQQETALSEQLVDDDPSIGPVDAPVTIVEFSDFQCPYCKSAASVVHQIIDTYGDSVRVVYRDFPLTSIHPHAQKAAEAAQCANDQGLFWEFHDIIFANQAAMAVDNLKQYAADLSLNSSTFDACLDSDKYKEEVLKDMQDGVNAGVGSTPTFFVGNEMVVGAVPFDNLKAVIDAQLNPHTTSAPISEASTLPTYAQSTPTVTQAYMISTEISDILAKVPCYCSCGAIGHDSLKECFISEDGEFADHASYCDICVSEALDVDQWYKEGLSIEEIRTRIDEKYSQYGVPTDTSL